LAKRKKDKTTKNDLQKGEQFLFHWCHPSC